MLNYSKPTTSVGTSSKNHSSPLSNSWETLKTNRNVHSSWTIPVSTVLSLQKVKTQGKNHNGTWGKQMDLKQIWSYHQITLPSPSLQGLSCSPVRQGSVVWDGVLHFSCLLQVCMLALVIIKDQRVLGLSKHTLLFTHSSHCAWPTKRLSSSGNPNQQ